MSLSFMSNLFSKAGSNTPARAVLPTLNLASSSSSNNKNEMLHYSIFHWRSHTDIRPSCNVLLVHDWLSTNGSWSPLISAMRKVPQPETEQELMLQQPLTLFCPDLPNHGNSPSLVSGEKSASLELYASSLLDFAYNVIPTGQIHLVGFGTGGAQIALLTAAAMKSDRFGSYAAILGGGGSNNKKSGAATPLVLDPSLDAQDLSKSCGDLSSLHQVDDFLAKLPSAKNSKMSDVMRYNTGTSHCGSTKWQMGTNRKGTPSLEAKSAKIHWNSNVVALRNSPDFGIEIDSSSAQKLVGASQQEPVSKAIAEKAYVIQDQDTGVSGSSSMQLIRSVFPDPAVLQVPNVNFEGLADGARGPTKEDANSMVVPFLSLYQDTRDWSQMNPHQ